MDKRNINDNEKLEAAESLLNKYDEELIRKIRLRSETDNVNKIEELNKTIGDLEYKRKKLAMQIAIMRRVKLEKQYDKNPHKFSEEIQR